MHFWISLFFFFFDYYPEIPALLFLFFHFFKKIVVIYFWPCWVIVAVWDVSLVAVGGGRSPVVAGRFLTVGTSLVEHGL